MPAITSARTHCTRTIGLLLFYVLGAVLSPTPRQDAGGSPSSTVAGDVGPSTSDDPLASAAQAWRDGRFEEARDAIEAVLGDLVDRARQLSHDETGDARLDGWVELLRSTGHTSASLDLARVHFERLLDRHDRHRDALVSSSIRLGHDLRAQGLAPEALDVFLAAESALAVGVTDDDLDLAGVRENIGLCHRDLGEHDLELERFTQARAAREAAHDPSDPRVLSTIAGQSFALLELGRAAEALQGLERVYRERAASPRTTPHDMAWIVEQLSDARFAVGDRQGALQLDIRRLVDIERLAEPDSPELAVVRAYVAQGLRDAGDHRGAVSLLRLAVPRYAAHFGAHDPWTLHYRTLLAHSLMALGELDEAEAGLRTVVADIQEHQPDERRRLIEAESNLCATVRRQGRHDEALAIARENLRRREQHFGREHPAVAYALTDLGLALDATSRFKEAVPHYRRALSIRREHQDDASPLLLETASRLALSMAWEGENEELADVADLLVAATTRRVEWLMELAPNTVRSSADQLLPVLTKIAGWLPQVAEDRRDEFERALFACVEGIRIAASRNAVEARGAASDERAMALREELMLLRNRIAESANRAVGSEAVPSGLERQLEGIQARIATLETDLRRVLAESANGTESPTVEWVSERLAEDEALLTFLRHTSDIPSENLAGQDVLSVFVLRSDGRFRREMIRDADRIEALLESWSDSLRTESTTRAGIDSEKEETEPRLASELYDALLAPILDPGEPLPSRLSVVADDFLHLVPFDALADSSGGRVGDRSTVRHAGSLADLFGELDLPDAPESLLVVSGVAFDADEDTETHALEGNSLTGTLRGMHPTTFAPLPQSRLEGEVLEAVFDSARHGRVAHLRGAKATKESFRVEAAGAKWIHVATHGWYSASRRALAQESDQTSSIGIESLARVAPETLCGLAFAGANGWKDDPSVAASTILTGAELASYDLSGCRLAVLSACETGLGASSTGRGIRSLRAALHAAGARHTITSVWMVDDGATRRLFELFYTGVWSEGLALDEALWRAKLALREEGHPVRDWAGWILTGPR